MAHANGIITAPINIETDIYAVLGIGPTSMGYDIGYACKNPKINKWAKFKPVRYNAMGIVSEYWKANDGKCGLVINNYASVEAMINDRANWWTYLPPTGGDASPFRSTDFDGYNHNAISPIHSLSVTPTEIGYAAYNKEIRVSGQFNLAVDNTAGASLSMNDFALSKGYFAAVIYRGDNLTNDFSKASYMDYVTGVNEIGVSNAFSIDASSFLINRRYFLVPFISKLPKNLGATNPSGNTFMPLPTLKTTEIFTVDILNTTGNVSYTLSANRLNLTSKVNFILTAINDNGYDIRVSTITFYLNNADTGTTNSMHTFVVDSLIVSANSQKQYSSSYDDTKVVKKVNYITVTISNPSRVLTARVTVGPIKD